MRKNSAKLVSFVLICCLAAASGINLFAVRADAADSSDFWMTVASNAWRYFQPGVGVNSQTGLPQNSVGSSYFTDWDAGIYIQAVIDAEKLGLIGHDGAWGFADRVDRFLGFLEKRPLLPDGLPYLAYNSATGQNYDRIDQVATDAGCLFVSLKNLETAEPQLKSRIDNIVYNLTNYSRRQVSVDILLPEMLSGKRLPNIYDYYVTCGFADFWPERYAAEADAILNLTVSSPKVTYQDVVLPQAKISSEPLLQSIYNLSPTDPRVLSLSEQAYLAQELRYNSTGKFTAFSEGFSSFGFIWEWVVLPDGRMWIVQTGDQNNVDTDLEIPPVVYLKAAIGFLAVYNTNYSQAMVNFLLKQIPASQNGYAAGIDEKGHSVLSYDFGNGLIVGAARYAVDHRVNVNFTYPQAPAEPLPTALSITSPTPKLTQNPGSPPSPPINASNVAPIPFVEPSPSITSKKGQSSLADSGAVDAVLFALPIAVIACILGFAGFRFGRKRLHASNTTRKKINSAAN